MSDAVRNSRIQDLISQRISGPGSTSTANKAAEKGVFDAVLRDQLKVSGHAATRLQSRNIELDGQQWQRVLDGVQKAADKGARESLVMIDDVALIVSVKNRTVITAVDQAGLKDQVFTNIDSAVIV